MLQDQAASLRNLAMDLGLGGGQRDYTRFVILARSRTGSNFLRGLLNSHSRVLTYGEIFRNTDQVDFAVPNYPTTRPALELYQRDPLRFLSRYVFRRMPANYRAVGFKLFYYHARTQPWQVVWDHLKGWPGLKLIHLKRRNMLHTHLSRARAERSNRWVNTSGEKEETTPIELSYDECLSDFERTQQWEADADQFFAGQPLVELFYEDLAADPDSHVAQLQAFLGLTPEKLAPQTHKQLKQPLSVAVANYNPLKARFAGSRWESFFEE